MDLLSVSALNNFVYCKRLFYYREVEHVEAENYYLVDGELKHHAVDGDEGEVRFAGEKIYGLALQSEALGISARFDVVEVEEGKRIPIEYKRGKAGDWRNHQIQLCAQALLIEEHFGQTLEYGYIYYYGSKKRVRVEFAEELRNATAQSIAEARQLIADAICPAVESSNLCEGCSMLEHCLPAETECVKAGKERVAKKVMPRLDDREILYITTSDVSIGKQSNRLVIKEEDQVVKEIPLIKISKVVLFGRVNLSHPVITLLLQNNIEVVYANYYGRYEGTLIPPENKNGLLRKRQILSSEDAEKCLYLSRQFVHGKVHNMRVLLQRRNWAAKDDVLAETIAKLKDILQKLEGIRDLDALRGMEGLAARWYFQTLDRLLSGDVEFVKRQRRPPKDPVNALLSLGYSLLTKDVEGYCRVVGFDPYTGFLHRDRYGKPSLALDLMEEFRPLIVDQVVLYALNSGILTGDDFEDEGFIL